MVFLLAFFTAAGIVLILWCLLGILLIPVFGDDMVTLCMAEGDGEDLEQKVRGYGWLRDGRLTGGRLVILNCGLSETGLKRVNCLCSQYDWVFRYDGEVPLALLGENRPEDAIYI